jgi:hypothetical protein
MKVRGYISAAPIANIHISGFWEFTRTQLFRVKLFRVKIQRFHTEPPNGLRSDCIELSGGNASSRQAGGAPVSPLTSEAYFLGLAPCASFVAAAFASLLLWLARKMT